MTEWERTQESCKHLFNAMEPKLLGVGYTARCIHCGKVSFSDLSKRAKNTEQQLQPDTSCRLSKCYTDTTQETINRFLTSCKRRK